MLERKVHAAFWFHEPLELAVLQSGLAIRGRLTKVAREAQLSNRENKDCVRARTIGMAVSLCDFVRPGWG